MTLFRKFINIERDGEWPAPFSFDYDEKLHRPVSVIITFECSPQAHSLLSLLYYCDLVAFCLFFCDNYIYHLVLQRNCLFIINYTWFCWNFETLSLFTLTAHTIKTHEVLPEFVEPPYHYKLQYYLVIFLLLECWLYVNVYVFLNPVRTSRGSTNQLTMTTHNNAANFMMLIAHHP